MFQFEYISILNLCALKQENANNQWKICVILPLNSSQMGMVLPFWCSLSPITLPLRGLSPPCPKKETYLPLHCISYTKNTRKKMQMKFKPTINSNHKHSYTVREMEDSADFLIE